MRTLLLALLIILSANLSCAATDSFTLDYSVSGNRVTILSAVTPYDATPKVRDSFLHWFQRGFETALKGEAPLLVEWQNTPQGRAGQDGYELGLVKGERFRGQRSGTERQTVPIPLPVR